jgi:hypothetical protein
MDLSGAPLKAVARDSQERQRHRYDGWAEAPIKIARMTLTIKLDGNWSSFQLANNTPPLSVTGSVIAPSARMRTLHFSGARHRVAHARQ